MPHLFCFHHKYKYPLPTDKSSAEKGKQALQNVTACLKATDAVMWKIVKGIKLDASSKVLYKNNMHHVDGRAVGFPGAPRRREDSEAGGKSGKPLGGRAIPTVPEETCRSGMGTGQLHALPSGRQREDHVHGIRQ